MTDEEREGFQDPSSLKGKDENFDENLIETLKKSEGVRWPGALMLMGVTLVVGLGLGTLFLRNNDEPIVRIDGPEITLPDIEILDIEMPDIELPTIGETTSHALGDKTIETAEGTFTEWFLFRGEEDLPNFIDYAWDAESDVIYLVGRDKNLYWIGPEREKIEFKDISVRLGESLPWLESVAVLDEERLLLLMDFNDMPLVIYNVVTDRVEKRIGDGVNPEASGQINIVADQGVVVGPNGNFYLINTYPAGGTEGSINYADEIQVYDNSGEQIRVFRVDRGAEALTVDQNGHIFLIGGFGSLFEYDAEGKLINEIERDVFDYSSDMIINREGQIYFVRPYDAWFVEIQPDREFGMIGQPTIDYEFEKWDIGEVRSPLVIVKNPNAKEFLILDGDYDFKRLFLFKPN